MHSICNYGCRKIRRIHEILGKKNRHDYKNIWEESYRRLYFPFFEELINKIDKLLVRYDDVVAYCHTVTINQFRYQFADNIQEDTLRQLIINTELDPNDFKLPPITPIKPQLGRKDTRDDDIGTIRLTN